MRVYITDIILIVRRCQAIIAMHPTANKTKGNGGEILTRRTGRKGVHQSSAAPTRCGFRRGSSNRLAVVLGGEGGLEDGINGWRNNQRQDTDQSCTGLGVQWSGPAVGRQVLHGWQGNLQSAFLPKCFLSIALR